MGRTICQHTDSTTMDSSRGLTVWMGHCGGQAAVENHLERTKLPHSIIERIMYTARIRHADRTRFEDCMGFTIKDWHTQVRRSPALQDLLLTSVGHLYRRSGACSQSMQ